MLVQGHVRIAENGFVEPVSCHSGSQHCLRFWHLTWMPVHVLATLLLIQVLADVLEEAVEDGLSSCASATHVRDPSEIPGSWL